MREFWIRDNKKYFNVSEKMTDHHYACFDHPNIEYPDYHVIEKKEADKLAAALEQISKADMDGIIDLPIIARDALRDYKGGK